MVHITVNHQKQYEKMTKLTNGWTLVFGLGVGATLLMDLWSAVLRRMGIATLNYAMLGRWCLHWRNGIWFHKSIKEAQPMGGENVVGWTLHYLTGIAFAQVFVLVIGRQWIEVPALAPALIFGAATVLFPWTVLQPALGAGFASAKTPRPWLSRVVSLAMHLVFGGSLYLCARAFTAL
ncbi:DUF2938 family protein [Comamonas thiooxydans]|uniref:DUF2938 family protein n=1 Tax=Comamonas TaxID=283 RepID=UPI001E3D9715|nr:DUF2938 family protein [Comamonas thiooxydans]